MRAKAGWALTFGLPAAVALAASISRAQRIEPGRGLTVVVGPPGGETSTERLDGARTGTSVAPLPSSLLRIIWTRQAGPSMHPPVVFADGTVVIVGEQGEAFLINPDGTERNRIPMGPGPMSAPVLLSDGTLVAINAAGDAVGVRRGAVVFRSHIVDPGPVADEEPHAVRRTPFSPGIHRMHGRHGAPLPAEKVPPTRSWLLGLDDGGFVAAVDRTLSALDANGITRTYATAPTPVGSPLLATRRGVAFVTDAGEVFVWDLRGAPDAVSSRGSFGGGVDGAVAAVDDRHLLGVVDGARLVALDLVSGETRTQIRVPRGSFTGAFAVDPPTGTALLEEMTLTGTRVLRIDREGHDAPFATTLSPLVAQAMPDAGALFTPLHTALFADRTGAVAFATVDGHVGVATMTSKVELGSLPCGEPPSASAGGSATGTRVSAGFAGLVPAGPLAFVIACEGGTVALVRGGEE